MDWFLLILLMIPSAYSNRCITHSKYALPHEDCEKYIACLQGEPVVLLCATGWRFDVISKSCQPAEFANCYNQPKREEHVPLVSPLPPCLQTDPKTPDKRNDIPEAINSELVATTTFNERTSTKTDIINDDTTKDSNVTMTIPIPKLINDKRRTASTDMPQIIDDAITETDSNRITIISTADAAFSESLVTSQEEKVEQSNLATTNNNDIIHKESNKQVSKQESAKEWNSVTETIINIVTTPAKQLVVTNDKILNRSTQVQSKVSEEKTTTDPNIITTETVEQEMANIDAFTTQVRSSTAVSPSTTGITTVTPYSCNVTKRISDPFTCKYYYAICSSGEIILEECPEYYEFSHIYLQCLPNYLANCHVKPTPGGTIKTADVTKKAPITAESIAIEVTTSVESAPIMTEITTPTKRNTISETISTSTDTTGIYEGVATSETTITSEGAIDRITTSIPSSCNEIQRIPDPYDCNYFYVVYSSGEIMLEECPEGYEFSPVYLQCLPKYLANCYLATANKVTIKSTDVNNIIEGKSSTIEPITINVSTKAELDITTTEIITTGEINSATESTTTSKMLTTTHPTEIQTAYNGYTMTYDKTKQMDTSSESTKMSNITPEPNIQSDGTNIAQDKLTTTKSTTDKVPITVEILGTKSEELSTETNEITTVYAATNEPTIVEAAICNVTELVPDRYDCKYCYVYCSTGEFTREKCPNDYEFSPVYKKCKILTATSVSSSQAGSTREKSYGTCYIRFLLPDPYSCENYYIVCTSAQVLHETCPHDYKFSQIYLKCLPPAFVSCDTDRLSKEETTTTVPTTTTECVTMYRLPDLMDCKYFYIYCYDGDVLHKKCPDDYEFSKKYLQCMPSYIAECDLTISSPETTIYCYVMNVLPDLIDCSLYYEYCSSGQILRKQCPSGFEFSKLYSECLPQYMAQCTVVTTLESTTRSSQIITDSSKTTTDISVISTSSNEMIITGSDENPTISSDTATISSDITTVASKSTTVPSITITNSGKKTTSSVKTTEVSSEMTTEPSKTKTSTDETENDLTETTNDPSGLTAVPNMTTTSSSKKSEISTEINSSNELNTESDKTSTGTSNTINDVTKMTTDHSDKITQTSDSISTRRTAINSSGMTTEPIDTIGINETTNGPSEITTDPSEITTGSTGTITGSTSETTTDFGETASGVETVTGSGEATTVISHSDITNTYTEITADSSDITTEPIDSRDMITEPIKTKTTSSVSIIRFNTTTVSLSETTTGFSVTIAGISDTTTGATVSITGSSEKSSGSTGTVEITADSNELKIDSTSITGSSGVTTGSGETTTESIGTTTGFIETTTLLSKTTTDSSDVTIDSTETKTNSIDVTTGSTGTRIDSRDVTTDSTGTRTDSSDVTTGSTGTRTHFSDVTTGSTKSITDSSESTADSTGTRTDSSAVTNIATGTITDSGVVTSGSTESITGLSEKTADSSQTKIDSTETKTDSIDITTGSTESITGSSEITADSSKTTADFTSTRTEFSDVTSEATGTRTDFSDVTTGSTESITSSSETTADSSQTKTDSTRTRTDSSDVTTGSTVSITGSSETTADSTGIRSDSSGVTSVAIETITESSVTAEVTGTVTSSNEITTPLASLCFEYNILVYFVPDPTDCSYYYVCLLGIPFRRRCSADLKFDENQLDCLPSSMANCSIIVTTTTNLPAFTTTEKTIGLSETTTGVSENTTGVSENTTGVSENTTDVSETAVDLSETTNDFIKKTTKMPIQACNYTIIRPVYYLPNLENCRQFYICYFGDLYHETCSKNYDFSPVYMMCLPPWQARCNIPTTTTNAVKFDDTVLYEPDPENCHNYYMTYLGKLYHQTCLEDLVFDPILLRCVSPSQSSCGLK